jgi:hypothetical protein
MGASRRLVLARVFGPFRKNFGPPQNWLPPLAEAPARGAGLGSSFAPPFHRAAKAVTVRSGLNNVGAIGDPV